MKYVFENTITRQLLQNWKRGAIEIYAGFFFNYRGTYAQKSFEGPLRSILRQILLGADCSKTLLLPFFKDPQFASSFASYPKINWTVPLLGAALSSILNQCTYKLDLFLFLDALDEFDGHLNMIIQFLKDISEQSEGSTTRVKICFSSRPWSEFKSNFGHCLHLSVEKFTRRDIERYCLSLVEGTQSPMMTHPDLIQKVATRAAGVFLWVRLVVADLRIAFETQGKTTVRELTEIIESLPQKLDEYYKLIIDRIPDDYRWETYVLLELVIRHGDEHLGPTLEYIMEAYSVSGCKNYGEACIALRQFRYDNLSSESHIEAIRSYCGGLLEVVKPTREPALTQALPFEFAMGGSQFTHDFIEPVSMNRPRTFQTREQNNVPTMANCLIQVMHQTVYEFVTSPRFRSHVLGEQSKIIWENGQSFHFKYNLSLSGEDHDLMAYKYASLAEDTTGQSQIAFIRSIPSRDFNHPLHGMRMKRFSSPLGFAVASKLVKCIQEWVLSPNWFDDVSEPLLLYSFLDFTSPEASYIEAPSIKIRPHCLKIIRALLGSGYHIRREPTFFPHVLSVLAVKINNNLRYELQGFCFIETEAPLPEGVYDDIGTGIDDDPEVKFLVSTIITLLEHGQDPNQFSLDNLNNIPPDIPNPMQQFLMYKTTQRAQPPLHCSPLSLAKKLISFGCDVNILNSSGLSALDLSLERFVHSDSKKQQQYFYELACLLAANDTPLTTKGAAKAYQAVESLNASNSDTENLSGYIQRLLASLNMRSIPLHDNNATSDTSLWDESSTPALFNRNVWGNSSGHISPKNHELHVAPTPPCGETDSLDYYQDIEINLDDALQNNTTLTMETVESIMKVLWH